MFIIRIKTKEFTGTRSVSIYLFLLDFDMCDVLNTRQKHDPYELVYEKSNHEIHLTIYHLCGNNVSVPSGDPHSGLVNLRV